MKKYVKLVFLSGLFLVFLGIPGYTNDRDLLDCYSPVMSPIASLVPKQPYSVAQEITRIKQDLNLSEKKAKGILGERTARHIVEKKLIKASPFRSKSYISLFTLFKEWGCKITPLFRNQSDNGIDDVFIVSPSKGNSSSYPIFHEAKYKKEGGLKLNKNIKSCDQLSVSWIENHLDNAYNKAFKQAELCFHPTQTTVKIKMPTCKPCDEKIKMWVNWLNDQFKEGNYYRTASVVDQKGIIKFYVADMRYSRQNLYSFLEFLGQKKAYKNIAQQSTQNGYTISESTLKNLSNNLQHAPQKKYLDLWEALKKAYPLTYQEFIEQKNN